MTPKNMIIALLSLSIRIQIKDRSFFDRCGLNSRENINVNVSSPSSRHSRA